ncbi:hypothetical protein AAHC03_05000 [Spirometra sp. Aus1]
MPLTSIGSAMWWWKLEGFTDRVELVLWAIEYACVLFVFLLGFRAPGLPNYALLYENLTNEQRTQQPPLTRWQRFRKRCIFLLPFILPRRNYLIQLNILLCTAILVSGRVVNLYVPILYKNVVNSLTLDARNDTPPHSGQPVHITESINNNFLSYFYVLLVGPTGLIYRWDLILLYVGIRAIQGVGSTSSGLLGALQSQLWIPVDQFSSRTLGIHLFQHLHDQSMNWHLSRKTGAMLRIVDRGTSSVSNILNYLLFNIIPTIVDIIVGIVYFITAFNFWYGLIVFVTMLAYLVGTVFITEWRTKFRRSMNSLDNVKSGVAVDSLLNFETVKYYTAESFEVNRYRKAIIDFQRANWLSLASLSVLNVVQSLVITLGLLTGTLLCAHAVVAGNLTLGDFVLFCTYMTQLYLPLNFFGTYYRMLQTSFVDLENMFELMENDSKISDIPNASALAVRGGKIEFKDVNFGYVAERPVLKNISFTVEPGKKLALVGQTGSGKSTIIRLLFRFYEPSGGCIFIDDQDISKVEQKSLRQAIGVVPQDTVLFNDTIGFNIRYGRNTATEEEMQSAARAAEMHDRIMEFPEGYDTIVGERGLKLSGGEKQRVAIARTILKAPRIVVLDEATSALDTGTERLIQESLDKVCENRTTIMVAHRLSTVLHADEILVLHAGEIVERGRHEDLIAIPGGRYAALWRQQSELSESSNNSTVGLDPCAQSSPSMST